jgi:aconitate hydratase
LGVRAVIAESFERIHRSYLVNMGVLPLQFEPGASAASLGLTGEESYDIAIAGLTPRATIVVRVTPTSGIPREIQAVVRIDTPEELTAFRHGGILPYVLRQLVDRTN